MSRGNSFLVDTRQAYMSGAGAAVLILAAVWAVGSLSGAEARQLLEGTMPSVRFLCSTAGAASTTILALMLTVLGLSQSHEGRFNETHYRRVRQIARFATWTLAASVFLLMVIVVPLGEAENVPIEWYSFVYYFILVSSALLGGLMVMVALMLYQAISGFVTVVHPDTDSPLLATESVGGEEANRRERKRSGPGDSGETDEA